MANVTLTPKEQSRLRVLNSLLDEHVTVDQVATLMGVSPRYTKRTLASHRKGDVAAVAYDHRGRRALYTTPEAVACDVVHFARTRYSGDPHCLTKIVIRAS